MAEIVKLGGEFDEGSNGLTAEMLQRVMPPGVKNSITPDLVNKINELLGDEELRVAYRDNLLSFSGVLSGGKYKIESYLNAVRYVTYKLMGNSNVVAYAKCFPDRYQQMLNEGRGQEYISSIITNYGKGQMVMKIMEQSLVPAYVMNQDLYQKALNVQADLMMNAKSEKVRTDAANSLLSQLKLPETQKIQLDIGVKEDDSIAELRRTTLELARQQRMMVEAGAMNAQQIAQSKLIANKEDES